MIKYRFHSRLFPLLLTISVSVFMTGLGFWQLDRAEQKTAVKKAFEQRAEKAPLKLGAGLLDESQQQFYNATAVGVFEPEFQVFEDNRIVDGRPGYFVFTPLRLAGTETRILVNRGWVPWGQDLTVAPNVDTPEEEVTLSGRLKLPTRGYYTLEENKPTRDQRIWQNLDLDHFRSLYGYPVQPLVLLLSPEVEGVGFKRQWSGISSKSIARHQGYAIQWFAMTFVLIMIFLWATIKKKHGNEENE